MLTKIFLLNKCQTSEKNKFIEHRIKQLISKYYEKYKIEVNYENVINKMDISMIISLNDLRQMNRIIRKEFLNFIKDIDE